MLSPSEWLIFMCGSFLQQKAYRGNECARTPLFYVSSVSHVIPLQTSEILNISKRFKNRRAEQKTCKAYNKLWAVGIILQNKMGHPAQ